MVNMDLRVFCWGLSECEAAGFEVWKLGTFLILGILDLVLISEHMRHRMATLVLSATQL